MRYTLLLIGIVTTLAQQRCGPPDNMSSLPDYAQEEIRDLWRSWRSGTSCDHELLLQSDVLAVIADLDQEEQGKLGILNSSGSKVNPLARTSTSDYPDDANEGSEVVLLRPDRVQQQRVAKSHATTNEEKVIDDYIDETTVDDVAMMQFDQGNAPFLKTASESVKRQFNQIWNDDDIPSEGLRALKIQTLAVSLLNSNQLEQYNSWATKRRRVLKAREQELRGLSRAAKRALRRMSQRQRDEPISIHPSVKKELSHFVARLNRRRSKKLLLVH